KARAYLAEAKAENKPQGRAFFVDEARLLFYEGEWEIAGKMLTADFEQSRRTGNRQEELGTALDLALTHRVAGERARAAPVLQRALEISMEAGDILGELTTRSMLAAMTADAGDAAEALPHLERCRQIVGAGEKWFGLAGGVGRAEAVVAAAQGQYAAAET